MKDFTRGISNHTGPDPNRLFSSYTSAAGGSKSKKKKKGGKKLRVGINPGQEEALQFTNDVLKFIQKRLKPGAGVVIVAGVSPVGLPIIKVGIGRVDNITTAYEFESANQLVDMEVRMNHAGVVLDISKDE